MTSIGHPPTPASPEICDIRAYELINSILEKFPYNKNIILHQRFRDDGLILFSGKLEHLKILFEIANSEHELLKFTFEYSDTSVNFLDVTIYKGNKFKSSNLLDTKSYSKKTESYQYLHRTSSHPPGTFKGFILSKSCSIN